MQTKTGRFITAYDPIVKKRVPHSLKNGKASSLVSGNSFAYKKNKK